MKDGYYLSTYMHIDDFASTAQIMVRHDQSVTLWHKASDNVRLVHHWELERVTGIKQFDLSLYSHANAVEIINFLLSKYNLTLENMVEVWGTPGLQTCEDYHSLTDYRGIAYHSIAHLFSSLMIDSEVFFNNDIIGLAVDGAPDMVIVDGEEMNYFCGCFSRKGKVDVFPVGSPGPLWTAAKRRTALREGTLMALGSASASEAFLDLEDIPEIGNYRDIFSTRKFLDGMIAKVFSFTEKDKGVLFNDFDNRFCIEDNKISMFVKIIQKLSIKIMENNIDNIIKKYEIDPQNTYLAISGGYGLNCPTNSYLMNKYKFKGFLGCPCINDSGLSLGIGLYAFYKKMNNIKFKLGTAYYGDSDEFDQVVLKEKGYYKYIEKISEFTPVTAVNDIKEGVMVWFNGPAEIGPRALGNRSLLADPRNEKAKDSLNIIKGRQWWRPVAPIVLEESVYEWFENAYPSPFMLNAFKIKKQKLSLVPAIAHLDGSARVQTLKRMDNELVYELIKAFYEDTGIPMLCNTSLNDKGEPIINTIEEAFNFALRKNIKVMYVNGKRIELKNHEKYPFDNPLPRVLGVVEAGSGDKQPLIQKINPYGLPKSILTLYYHTPMLRKRFDITDKRDTKIFLRVLKKIYRDDFSEKDIRDDEHYFDF